MTSKAPSGGNGNILDRGDPYYTNEDVALLHTIVSHAEQLLPSLPPRERVATNALFNAYYTIIPTVGINADHDNRYARILFKIGGMQGTDKLYEKFEAVLAKIGIEIQFEHDGRTEHDARSTGSPAAENTEAIHDTKYYDFNNGRRRRRNSESTLWDFVAGPEYVLRPRSQSSTSKPAPTTFKQQRLQIQDSRSRFSRDDKTRQKGAVAYSSRIRDVGAWLNDTFEAVRPSLTSASGHRQMKVPRQDVAPHQLHPSQVVATTSSMDQDFYGSDSTEGVPNQMLPERFTHDHLDEFGTILSSTTLLDIKASLVRETRLLRSGFLIWRQKAANIHGPLCLSATENDRITLLRQAFESWRMHIQARYQLVETERFFSHLERRATRARDLFLLTKAFTYWAEVTSDELYRTSLARHHILRTRLFKAWRDITAVNELKTRRNVLKKFFNRWRSQHADLLTVSATSLIIYEENLVKKKYWAWFWAFCELRAPAWWAARSKRKILKSWIFTARRFADRQFTVFLQHDTNVKTRSLLLLRTSVQENAKREANSFRHYSQVLGSKTLLKWKSESALVPPRNHMQLKIAARLKHDILELWRSRSSQERQSSAVYKRKVTGEAWVTWSLRLRHHALQAQASRRIAAQALYTWVISARLSLIARTKDDDLQRRALAKFRQETNSGLDMAAWSTQCAEALSAWHAKSKALGSLISALRQTQSQQAQASNVYASRFTSATFQKWSLSLRHTNVMRHWAHDGAFYFLSKRTINKWKESTDRSRKEKIRQAYSIYRRQSKIDLARKILGCWRLKAEATCHRIEQADSAYLDRLVIIGMEGFDIWRAKSEEVIELAVILRQSTLRKSLQHWRATATEIQNVRYDAASFCNERIMSKCLKKWTREALLSKGQGFVVKELREKHKKHTCRRILLYWRQRTPLSSQTTEVEDATINAQSRFGETARAEVWSEFGDDLDTDEWARDVEGLALSTPVPGYLATPSRLVQRARTIGKQITTTPSAHLSSPFEKLLRAQYPAGSLAAKRGQANSLKMGPRGFQDVGKSA